MSVSMPGEGRLPPGPLRDLTHAVHVSYENAGKPGTRKISDAIRDRGDLPDTVSHEAVRNILLGSHVGWLKLECVILQLVTWDINKPDPEDEKRKFHKLWIRVEESATSQFAANRADRISSDEISPTSTDTADVSAENDQNLVSRIEDRGTLRAPLVSWRTPAGTLEVYDRQMAIQLINNVRLPNE
jgi:hypothetical protein